MKKLGLVIATILVLAVLLLMGVRVGLGYVVKSEAFRTALNEQLDRGVRGIFPPLMSEIKSTELTGLADLALGEVTVRNSRKIEASLDFPRVLISPELMSLISGDTWRYSLDAMVGVDGRLSLTGAVPSWVIRGGTKERTPSSFHFEGTFANADAVALSNLLFPDQAAPGFYLNHGSLSGTIQFSKPLGLPAAAGKKNGRFTGKLEDATWILAEEQNRPLLMTQIALNLELIDDAVLIRTPIILQGHTGRANITGSLLLPRSAAANPAWNLIVNVESDTGLSGSLGKLFKCTTPVAASHYTVKGSVTATTCTP